MNNTNIEDYQVKQYDGVNSLRDVLFDEEEVRDILSVIDRWFKYLNPYHNYYDDVEFMENIKYYLLKDGCLSNKQITRLSKFNL
jgi:hypothetical protein